MNTVEEVRKISEMNNVKFHHCDIFQTPIYKNVPDLESAVVIVYSSQHGAWQMAINEDGTISKPNGSILKSYKAISESLNKIYQDHE